MKVSCLMPTYNRCPHQQFLIDEAVRSFLLQDYEDKELIICNDTPGQRLIFSQPGVRVFNLSTRFPTLSDKLEWMIGEATGDVLCRWDDDDICLPHRLTYSMNKLGVGLEWRAENYFYCPMEETIYVEGPGNTHCMAVWRREVLDAIGGYPPKASGWEDQAFNQALHRAGISEFTGEVIPAEDIFYLYRWGVSDRHLSGSGGGPEGLQRHYDSIGNRPIAKDMFDINPKWHQDYTARAEEGLFRHRKEVAEELH
jgi:glycosyltransferase involved in cell wall biosynthesis